MKVDLSLLSEETNIIEQIPFYNANSVDNFINELINEINNQEKIKKMLEDDDFKSNIQKINHFVDNYKLKIDDQLELLEDLTKNIKKITRENKKLMNNKKQYEEILKSEKCKDIACKIRKIKAFKSDTMHFLEQQGINL